MRLAFSTDIVRVLGLNSTLLLDYFNIKIKNTNDFVYNLPAIKIEKTKITSKDSDLFFMKPKDFSEALENLLMKGLLIQFCKEQKKTKYYTINILNLLLLDLLQGFYFDFLHEINDDYGYGYFVCCNEAFTPTGLFVSDYCYTTADICVNGQKLKEDDLLLLLKIIYNTDLYNLDNWVSSIKDRTLPMKTINCAYPDKTILKSFQHFDYYDAFFNFLIDVAKGIINPTPEEIKSYKRDELQSKEIDLDDTNVYVQKTNKLLESARSVYADYCKYLQMGEVIKKPVENWTASDFVKYMYCAVNKYAKPPYIFPNYGKDGKMMKKYIERFGKEKLKDYIYYLGKHKNDFMEKARISDLTITISTLNVDWIIQKLDKYINEIKLKQQGYSVNQAFEQKEKEIHSENKDDRFKDLLNKFRQNIKE
ncbi:MAG: hypothetical protein ACP6IQ_02210 [Candidatus Njordarchaeia archaeon]